MIEKAAAANPTAISDRSRVFNTARVEALELDNLVEVALATMTAAHAREESRGAHFRSDFPQTDEAARRTFLTLADAERIAAESECAAVQSAGALS